MDKDTGIVHSVEVTSANVHDVEVTPKLLTGEEDTVNGDSGYIGAEKRDDAVVHNKKGKKLRYNINRRPSQYKNNSTKSKAQIKRREHEKSSVRAKVEHVFAVIHKRTVRVPKDTVPRSAKTDRQTEYAVRSGESDLC